MTDNPRGWQIDLFEPPGSAPIFHILPVADLVGHETLSTCACGPGIEELDDLECGGMCLWHHALDGRAPLIGVDEV